MIGKILNLVRAEASGERALSILNRLVLCHRIQSSPGFREAVAICEETAGGWGLETEILKFKADGKTSYWGCLIQREWEATEATLELVEPERVKLADFSECKISLIQRSVAAHADSIEIVLLEDGLETSEYENIDVAGKLVLTKGDIERVHALAVQKYGAAGILYDGIVDTKPARNRLNLPDAREYKSFWWKSGDKRCFGFVITPRQGDWLRSLLISSERLRARVNIDATFRDGTTEVLSCFIPGQTLEEVLLVAHLCHPQPSANDNASGCVSVLEAMRTLNALVSGGQIGPLRRGIRALLLPEMTGSFSYLAANEERLADIVCALNVDMAGENQTLCGSTMIVEAPPDSCRGFVLELGSLLLERVFERDPLPRAKASLRPERTSLETFNAASDHAVFSDREIGIPCPSINQWPDKFYHTSLDTPDKVDPAMLKAAASIAGTFAGFVATASGREARWLGLEMLSSLKQSVTKEIRTSLQAAAESESPAPEELNLLRRRLSYALERAKDAMEHLERLGLSSGQGRELREDANEWVRREFAQAERDFPGFLDSSRAAKGGKRSSMRVDCLFLCRTESCSARPDTEWWPGISGPSCAPRRERSSGSCTRVTERYHGRSRRSRGVGLTASALSPT
ncbi:MAG: DUF4910 domain-containing protein [Candidatus Eisenbacteria bacterium]